jgi:hypothetical protein
MTEETKTPEFTDEEIAAMKDKQEKADTLHAQFLIDAFTRLLAGRALHVILTALFSVIYNLAKAQPELRETISLNVVELGNNILALDNPPADDSQQSLDIDSTTNQKDA